MSKPLTAASLSVFEIRRPVTQDIIGYRAKLAHPNKAKVIMMDGKPVRVTSYDKPYLINQSGDYNDPKDKRLMLWIAETADRMNLRIVG